MELLFGERLPSKPKARRADQAHSRDRHQSRRSRARLLRWLRHDRSRRAQDGPALDHGRAWRALPHPHHPATDEGDRRATIRAASPRRSAGRVAAGSATSGSRRRCWRRMPGAGTSINRSSTRRCWPRRSASWKGSPTRRARRVYWQHGPLDRARLHLRHDEHRSATNQLQQLSEEVGPERTLLVACGSFRAERGRATRTSR